MREVIRQFHEDLWEDVTQNMAEIRQMEEQLKLYSERTMVAEVNGKLAARVAEERWKLPAKGA